MNTHADKTQERKSQPVANDLSQKKSNSESTSQVVDNRPVALVQRKLQDMTNNSPQAERAAQFQAMADNQSSLQQPEKSDWINNANKNFPNSAIEVLSCPIQQKQYYNKIAQLMPEHPQQYMLDLESQNDYDDQVVLGKRHNEPPPDIEGNCALVGNAFKTTGSILCWAVTASFKNTLPNPKVIYDNWDSGDTNEINDTKATNLTWEADKIAWIKGILLTIAALIPIKGVYDTVSAFVTGNLEVEYSPTISFIPSSELTQENNESMANSAIVASLLAVGASLHHLETKIRNRISFISPTPSDRNATRRIAAHMHND